MKSMKCQMVQLLLRPPAPKLQVAKYGMDNMALAGFTSPPPPPPSSFIITPDLISKWELPLQIVPILAAKKDKRKSKIKIDDCTGNHKRRYEGFNKPCPPPPCQCPPGSTKPKDFKKPLLKRGQRRRRD